MISFTISVGMVHKKSSIYINTLYAHIYQNNTMHTLYVVIHKLLRHKKWFSCQKTFSNFLELFLGKPTFLECHTRTHLCYKRNAKLIYSVQKQLENVHGCVRSHCLRCHLNECERNALLQRSPKKFNFCLIFDDFLYILC